MVLVTSIYMLEEMYIRLAEDSLRLVSVESCSVAGYRCRFAWFTGHPESSSKHHFGDVNASGGVGGELAYPDL